MSTYLKVPFTEEEFVWVKQAAKENKMTARAFVKELFWHSMKEYTQDMDKEYTSEFVKLGMEPK